MIAMKPGKTTPDPVIHQFMRCPFPLFDYSIFESYNGEAMISYCRSNDNVIDDNDDVLDVALDALNGFILGLYKDLVGAILSLINR